MNGMDAIISLIRMLVSKLQISEIELDVQSILIRLTKLVPIGIETQIVENSKIFKFSLTD